MLRPSGTLLLAACFGALLAVGARAAESQQGFFDVRVRGEITKRWAYVETNPDTECDVRRTYRGTERITFRSRRPTRILVRSRPGGSLALRALLRNLSGTYTQTGSRADRSTNPECRKPVAYSARCSSPRRSANRGGTMSISAPRRGVIQLGSLRLRLRLPRAVGACEPRGVAELPAGAEIASARAQAKDIFDPGARAVELDAGVSETTTFSGGDTGRATVNVEWTLSFEPVGG